MQFWYPSWWNNLVAGLDILANLGFRANGPDVRALAEGLDKRQLDVKLSVVPAYGDLARALSEAASCPPGEPLETVIAIAQAE